MATSTIKPKCGTSAQWESSGRVLEENEWGVEVTPNGHHILRIGDGEHLFHELPAVFDAENYEALMTLAVNATAAANTAAEAAVQIANEGKNNANAAAANANAATVAALAAADTASIAAQANTNAIIKDSSGDIVTVNDSSNLALVGLKLYGKATQDGTPTPNAPVPLVSVGDGGKIEVSVTDGTDENVQTLSASTPNGLPGIPVTSGGNYTDANGQQWVCDEVDFARGVYVKRVLQEVVTPNHECYTYESLENSYAVTITYRPKLTRGFCSHYPVVNWSETSTGKLGMYINSTANQIIFANTDFSTVAEMTAFIAQQYNSATPIKIVYPLRESIETPLSAEEIAAFKALNSNKPNTTVYNDSGAGMSVEYIADTKTYIDNKFTELQSAILSAGANV